MKKILVPLIALLTLSMLSTSVSANNDGYYMASFYGEAEGCCWVAIGPDGLTAGKGSFYVRGLAIVREDTGPYWANTSDPNTRLWTRRTLMTLSWNNEKLTVWMWPSYMVGGAFNDTVDAFILYNMSYFGCYKGEAGLEFIWGTAHLLFQRIDGAEPVSVLQMMLVQGTEPFLQVYWLGGVVPGPPPGCVARSVIHGVTVWGPIPWHPSGPIY